MNAATFDRERREMVEHQLRGRGIRAARVLEAMERVPRHEFVPAASQSEAYADRPLPIGVGQTISQPLMVAAMSEALELTGSERVLEIGTGSGYQTAVLAQLASAVFSIEYRPELARSARERLERLGCGAVRLRQGDGGLGWGEQAPFDAILVGAAAPLLPPPLLEQLGLGGRLVIPVGDEPQQDLLQVRKTAAGLEQRRLHACRFVPLQGIHGWGRRLFG
jgi:protein-L-isoaspartate(D-aspartate) O-methyltransferase